MIPEVCMNDLSPENTHAARVLVDMARRHAGDPRVVDVLTQALAGVTGRSYADAYALLGGAAVALSDVVPLDELPAFRALSPQARFVLVAGQRCRCVGDVRDRGFVVVRPGTADARQPGVYAHGTDRVSGVGAASLGAFEDLLLSVGGAG
jgi:hypothetical protein